MNYRVFPGGPEVKNPPSNAGDPVQPLVRKPTSNMQLVQLSWNGATETPSLTLNPSFKIMNYTVHELYLNKTVRGKKRGRVEPEKGSQNSSPRERETPSHGAHAT